MGVHIFSIITLQPGVRDLSTHVMPGDLFFHLLAITSIKNI